MKMSTITTITLNAKQEAFRKKMTNGWAFGLYAMFNVPAGFFAGMKIKSLDGNSCATTIPYKWLNKNPFKSTYFAVQSMAAELSTAALAMLALQSQQSSVAFIIVNLEAAFLKKATDKVTFTCEEGHVAADAVAKAVVTGEATTARLKTVGRMPDGTVVSVFYFTWSFKQRKG